MILWGMLNSAQTPRDATQVLHAGAAPGA